MPLPEYEPRTPIKRLIYDFETTGRSPRFSEPIQYAAIVTDNGFNELSSIDLRGRPTSFALPDPHALVTHGVGFHELHAASCSQRELMVNIHDHLANVSPVHVMGYNSLSFDEEFMRHASYKTLLPPYVHQWDGNSRGDVMRLAKVAYNLWLGALNVPTVEGRPSFKLENLAPANGFQGHKAHDALGDVRATAYVADCIRTEAPNLWAYDARWASKRWVQELLEKNDVVVQVRAFGRPSVLYLAPICPNPEISTEWLMVNLSYPVDDLREVPVDEMVAMMRNEKNRKRIHRVKTNDYPCLFPIDDPLVDYCIDIARETLTNRARAVRGDDSLAHRLRQAVSTYRAAFEKPKHVEEQLYNGLISKPNQQLCNKFHKSEPRERREITQNLSDPRLRELGLRLIYDETPEDLPMSNHCMIESNVHSRMLASVESPWVTIPYAMQEIEKITIQTSGANRTILQEYHNYLDEHEDYLFIRAAVKSSDG